MKNPNSPNKDPGTLNPRPYLIRFLHWGFRGFGCWTEALVWRPQSCRNPEATWRLMGSYKWGSEVPLKGSIGFFGV